MYPSIITDSLELNVPYFTKLIALLFLDNQEYEESFDLKKPESMNDFLQLQFIHGLINVGIIEIKETPRGTMVNVKGEFLPSN
ncbi:hypothetical protein HOO68_04725 [Candidatus Gracilibacteria bacterium]|nr:hypothetical protein [Candidatus Gracilibacteria bacterium]